MREFTIELDEMICKWLEHISEITGKSIEEVIAIGIYNQVIAIEDRAFKAFAASNFEGL